MPTLPKTVIVLGAIAVVTIAGLMATGQLARTSPDETGASTASLERLQDRIDRETPTLARQGVYVRTTSLEAHCAAVVVENLTAPNRRDLEQRYGEGACLRQASGPPAAACALVRRRDTGLRKPVPDVSDLGLYEAQRRLVAAGFTFSIECPGQSDDRPIRPSRFSPDALVRITRQCPAPGATLPDGAPVALQAEAVLPGGHRYVTGAFRGRVACKADGLQER